MNSELKKAIEFETGLQTTLTETRNALHANISGMPSSVQIMPGNAYCGTVKLSQLGDN